jgi:HSP20 family molecular chaperone IbpA
MESNVETKNQENGIERTRPLNVIVPRCDIFEGDDAVTLLAEMPGVDEKSIDVSLERHILTISGRAEPKAPAGHRRIYAEFDAGEYRRAFELSNEAQAEGITAEIQNGVLRVTVPKSKPAHRKIPVLAR